MATSTASVQPAGLLARSLRMRRRAGLLRGYAGREDMAAKVGGGPRESNPGHGWPAPSLQAAGRAALNTMEWIGIRSISLTIVMVSVAIPPPATSAMARPRT